MQIWGTSYGPKLEIHLAKGWRNVTAKSQVGLRCKVNVKLCQKNDLFTGGSV